MNITDEGADHHQERHDAPDSGPAQLALELELSIAMPAPCPDCGCTDGTIITITGQDPVRCAGCGRCCYNVPSRTKTGRPRQSLRTRPEIKVRERMRILLRDNCACFWCHRRDMPLEIGHMVSVCDGHAWGLSDAELYRDENLAAMCASCNSGLWRETAPLSLLVAALRARIASRDGREVS